ncbi:GTP 3',8-cyclase MoaA [Sphingomonas histidinilytica]|jgi:cyclic pyranopterin phosphate synthase|uniref:GTP 3',8-cyclase n=1 Tax=Rhizorhabdus histidinilytica TaxID=439228 RepID=A0A1T5G7Z6_9SPHN|nr:GTP 3',8-cyclase MoaA [Rhizorhabdus histidinilytica]MBO9375484.1 GTP 3',8-cyclase MoaA [Rhizorhabdus histidinilytica]QEH77158.1 GTP 3',8-cyclase MoaA [Sphingomonas sp. C8-2]SKC04494.1 cyclic pyranopterin monophosphate synthase subunit MoaA [Rhizorhabdus histidinilytica]
MAAMEKPGDRGGTGLADAFGRRITYLRLSVTDRCDFRCRYCMAEKMQFLPKREILTIEELATLADAFIARGIRKIRLTGGEPLVRRGIDELVRLIGRRIGAKDDGGGLDELTVTTNASQLRRHASALAEAGVRRVNVSVDSLDPERFGFITRGGDLAVVLDGIAAAREAGIAVKVNMVALRDLNEQEIEPMLRWCAAEGHDLTLIETMPLGEIEDDRTDRYLPLDGVRRRIEEHYTLSPLDHRTGGPARYFRVEELGARLGLITPLTNNFCDGCNRVRVTATGQIYMCLGHEDRLDLRQALRAGDMAELDRLLDRAMRLKPERHAFRIDTPGAAPAVSRHMSVTGG